MNTEQSALHSLNKECRRLSKARKLGASKAVKSELQDPDWQN